MSDYAKKTARTDKDFFYPVENPQELVEPHIGCVHVIRTSQKTYIKYFTENEEDRITEWKLSQIFRFVPKCGETINPAV